MPGKTFTAKVELPLDWFSNPIDGDRHRVFMANLLAALTRCTSRVEVVEVPWGADFAERRPPKDGVLFSYHSVGWVPGVWRLKEAPIPPLYAIDKSGHSGWSQIFNSRDLQEKAKSFDLGAAEEVIARYREKFIATGASKYPQLETQEDLPERYVFLPLQVPADPVALYAHMDAITLLTEAAHVAAEEKVHVLVKRHPFCSSVGIKECVSDLAASNPYFRVVSGNVHTLIQNSLSVLTVNSGVGLEALIHGKPVYACGRSEWQPAADAVWTAKDIRRAFRLQQPEISDASKAYIGYLLSEYWVDSADFAKMYERVRRCVEISLGSEPEEYAIEESRLVLHDAAEAGDALRNLHQANLDLDFMSKKAAGLQVEVDGLKREVQRLAAELEGARSASDEEAPAL